MKRAGAVPNALPARAKKSRDPLRKKTGRTNHARRRGKQDGSEGSRPQAEERPSLDGRIPGLLFDSLASVQAAIVSASKGVPYRTFRQAMALDQQEKHELTSAAQAVAVKHPAFFAQHKDALEFATVLTAINAAHMDHLFSLLGQSDDSPAQAEPIPPVEHVCSAREALGMALIVLAPLGLFALVLLIQHLRRK
jgi:hypothetical protein